MSNKALRHLVFAGALFTSMLFHAARASALELVMFDAAWCPNCHRFKSEVLPAYDETRTGRFIPLQLVDEGDDVWFELDSPVNAFPTFVLVDDGVEVGRFSGYGGVRGFYDELADLAQ